MRMHQLSNRLLASAGMITPGYRVADIGCDHAYTAIYLVTQGISPKVIGLDVNKGPLEKATANIDKYKLSNRIELRLSDGANALNEGEVDAFLISGMGGPLTVRILEDGKQLVSSIKELVLQPQSELASVRHYLHDNGFCIAQERMVFEDGKYYVSIHAIPGIESYEEEYDYEYGTYLVNHQDPVAFQFYEKEGHAIQSLIDELQKREQVTSVRERMQQLVEQKNYLEHLRDMYTRGNGEKDGDKTV